MSRDINEIRDTTFCRIGRTVVNFQRLELALKSLIPTLSVSGPPHDLEARRERRVRALDTCTLGRLVPQFHAEVYGPPLSEHYQPDDDETSITVSMGLDPEKAEQRMQGLLSLVDERNRLIHVDLSHVDFNSPEACDELCVKLDEQNERVCRHLAYVESIRDAHWAALAEFRKLLESKEFVAAFLGPPNPT